MTAAAFSADGSVLAVAAESVITLWDPDNNALVGVIAETLSVSDQTLTCVVCFASALKQQFDVCQLLYLQPITNLSFVGTSVFLMSLCQSSRPEVTVWNVSNLSMQWAYSIYAEGKTTLATQFVLSRLSKAKILCMLYLLCILLCPIGIWEKYNLQFWCLGMDQFPGHDCRGT